MNDIAVRSHGRLDGQTEVPDWLVDGRFEAVLAEIAAQAVRHDRDGSFPREAVAALVALGVHRLTAPRSHGGWQAGLTLAQDVLARIAGADSSVALVILWQFVFFWELSLPESDWSQTARNAVLSSLAEGDALINAINVEPELGSPSRGGLPATRGVRADDGSWRLSGRKIYSTGVPVLRWFLVAATIVDDREPRIGTFLVDARQGGFDVDETWDHIGLRASASHDILFKDAVVPAGFLVTQAEPGQRPAAYSGPRAIWTCGLLGALYNGIAHAARDWLLKYLRQRIPSNLGAPLASLPRFQTAVGQIEQHLGVSDRLLRYSARAYDSGQDRDRREALDFAPLLKQIVTGNAIAVTAAALELTGNPGHSRHNPIERYYRDALTGRIHAPQGDLAWLNAGKAAFDRIGAD